SGAARSDASGIGSSNARTSSASSGTRGDSAPDPKAGGPPQDEGPKPDDSGPLGDLDGSAAPAGPDPDDDGGLGSADPDLLGPMIAKAEALVQLAAETSESLASVLEDYEAEEGGYFPSIGYHLLRVDPGTDVPGLVETLLGDPRVANAQPNHLYVAAGGPDALLPVQWAHRNLGPPEGGLADADIDTDEAWSRMSGARRTGVAILDTGFANHQDLPDARKQTVVAAGPEQHADHGTKVAGILAALGDNTIGIAGVNKRWADLVLIKIFDNAKTTSDANLIRGIEAAERVKVVNLSVSGLRLQRDLSRPHPLCEAIRARSDVLFVIAAGNENAALPNYPSACGWLNGVPNVISVASSDKFDLLALTSNFGPWVDLAAPGEGIVTTLADGRYGLASGTSMAAPQVAGVASLLFARTSLGVQAVKQAVLESVDVLPQLVPFVSTGGRLNACRALRRAGVGPTDGCAYAPGR
ncbi:MAG: S8 family peptidase, partial [Candidatus Binatia bacterium]